MGFLLPHGGETLPIVTIIVFAIVIVIIVLVTDIAFTIVIIESVLENAH